MATRQHSAVNAYQCPKCTGALSFDNNSWDCTHCGHVPRHSAD
ncbi:hypothetical protein [Haloarcula marina]|nr:hypothetical protein [Halomicroarcula marina]